MLAASFKRTKIIATIGPSSNEPIVLDKLIQAGANGIRLNMSHGTHDWHAEVVSLARKISTKRHRPVAIIVDLQGPRIRVGSLPTDGLPLIRGHAVHMQYDANFEQHGVIPIQHDVSKYVKPGERIFLRDGQIEIEVVKVEKRLITANVITPGILFSNQGMNLPDTDLGGEILTDKDLADIDFAIAQDADYIALSFVQTAQDVINLKKHLEAKGSDIHVIAKIETKAAVENLEIIVQAAQGLMVARGDLAIETKPEAVPAVQRRMIELSKLHKKPVIVATQMLESMIQSPQPTRAEVSDVATAVLEGSDAVMLSGETAMGLFPVETVQMMKRVILYTEREEIGKLAEVRTDDYGAMARDNAISAAAVVLAKQLPAKVIIAETSSGQTARNIASLRPSMPIVMVTDKMRVYNQMAIVWGGKSYYNEHPAQAADAVIRELKSAGNVEQGDAVVIASGHQPGITGGTDTLAIQIVR